MNTRSLLLIVAAMLSFEGAANAQYYRQPPGYRPPPGYYPPTYRPGLCGPLVGAGRGAMRGAIFGRIVGGDPGKGAAWGAIIGGSRNATRRYYGDCYR